ncbi:MAG: flagellar biosynthesis anti-sigma factor FlgM [Firmicutes bacterium]|nr:flagellar biosynthesis anti-sigma factor FlgM [Bacillota bacterium]
MIISGKQVQNVIKTYAEQNKTTRNCQVKNNNVAMKPDEVILSSQGQEFGHIYQTYKNMPEVRQDKVKEISERISHGNYNVAAEDVATKIMG